MCQISLLPSSARERGEEEERKVSSHAETVKFLFIDIVFSRTEPGLVEAEKYVMTKASKILLLQTQRTVSRFEACRAMPKIKVKEAPYKSGSPEPELLNNSKSEASQTHLQVLNPRMLHIL